jgi:hypothetical protein
MTTFGEAIWAGWEETQQRLLQTMRDISLLYPDGKPVRLPKRIRRQLRRRARRMKRARS